MVRDQFLAQSVLNETTRRLSEFASPLNLDANPAPTWQYNKVFGTEQRTISPEIRANGGQIGTIDPVHSTRLRLQERLPGTQ